MDIKLYLELLISFIKVGAFSFGGGYAALPLIQDEVVTSHNWLDMSEFTNLITISQMTPGPIAINSATFVGIKIAGIPGAIVATIGCVLPACFIVTTLAWLYIKFRKLDTLQGILTTLRPAVVAMIATAGVSILVSSFWGGEDIVLSGIKISAVVIFVICMVLLMKFKMNPILVMLLAGVMNVVYSVAAGVV
mgnify:CR=1 FL=1